MGLPLWRFIALMLAALSLTMESAHVLELPQKMQYDAQMYTAVNGTLYRYFAIVGGTYQLDSIIAAAIWRGWCESASFPIAGRWRVRFCPRSRLRSGSAWSRR